MSKPRALDLFCGGGGATRGLQRAGFHVTGIDIKPQPRYCGDTFVQADALESPLFLSQYDFIWASPPCQAFTTAQRIRGKEHPNFIEEVRYRLSRACVPSIIENVLGAPLRNPFVLCGSMFGLKTYRHRIFEWCGFDITLPDHKPHITPQTKMGRPPKEGDFIQVVGNFSNVAYAREAMGIDWMTRDELREAIPPAYSEFIGLAALASCGALCSLDDKGCLE